MKKLMVLAGLMLVVSGQLQAMQKRPPQPLKRTGENTALQRAQSERLGRGAGAMEAPRVARHDSFLNHEAEPLATGQASIERVPSRGSSFSGNAAVATTLARPGRVDVAPIAQSVRLRSQDGRARTQAEVERFFDQPSPGSAFRARAEADELSRSLLSGTPPFAESKKRASGAEVAAEPPVSGSQREGGLRRAGALMAKGARQVKQAFTPGARVQQVKDSIQRLASRVEAGARGALNAHANMVRSGLIQAQRAGTALRNSAPVRRVVDAGSRAKQAAQDRMKQLRRLTQKKVMREKTAVTEPDAAVKEATASPLVAAKNRQQAAQMVNEMLSSKPEPAQALAMIRDEKKRLGLGEGSLSALDQAYMSALRAAEQREELKARVAELEASNAQILAVSGSGKRLSETFNSKINANNVLIAALRAKIEQLEKAEAPSQEANVLRDGTSIPVGQTQQLDLRPMRAHDAQARAASSNRAAEQGQSTTSGQEPLFMSSSYSPPRTTPHEPE